MDKLRVASIISAAFSGDIIPAQYIDSVCLDVAQEIIDYSDSIKYRKYTLDKKLPIEQQKWTLEECN